MCLFRGAVVVCVRPYLWGTTRGETAGISRLPCLTGGRCWTMPYTQCSQCPNLREITGRRTPSVV